MDALGAWRNIPDWYDKVAGWCGLQGLPTSTDILNSASGWFNSMPGAGDLGTGMGGLIRDLMGVGFPLPGLKPYPYSMGFDPFSPFGTGFPGLSGGGAGMQLPGGSIGSSIWGAGSSNNAGGTGSGVPLGTGAQASGTGTQWGIPAQPTSASGNPYEKWKNPYEGWENPYKGWKNPYEGWVNPYKN